MESAVLYHLAALRLRLQTLRASDLSLDRETRHALAALREEISGCLERSSGARTGSAPGGSLPPPGVLGDEAGWPTDPLTRPGPVPGTPGSSVAAPDPSSPPRPAAGPPPKDELPPDLEARIPPTEEPYPAAPPPPASGVGEVLASAFLDDLERQLKMIADLARRAASTVASSPASARPASLYQALAQHCRDLFEALEDARHRPAATEVARLELGDELRDIVRMLRPHAEQHQVSLDLHAEADLPAVPGKPSDLRHLLVHLLARAIAQRRAGEAVALLARPTTGGVELQLHGFDPPRENAESLPEPVPPVPLTLARQLAERLDGTLESTETDGRIRIVLPSSPEPAPGR